MAQLHIPMMFASIATEVISMAGEARASLCHADDLCCNTGKNHGGVQLNRMVLQFLQKLRHVLDPLCIPAVPDLLVAEATM